MRANGVEVPLEQVTLLLDSGSRRPARFVTRHTSLPFPIRAGIGIEVSQVVLSTEVNRVEFVIRDVGVGELNLIIEEQLSP
ncbi:MAG: hypothetical protein EXR62_05685 [Chloroflexi bacterium]|nr:hypothetical protein [Chloroflexota bacterium]